VPNEKFLKSPGKLFSKSFPWQGLGDRGPKVFRRSLREVAEFVAQTLAGVGGLCRRRPSITNALYHHFPKENDDICSLRSLCLTTFLALARKTSGLCPEPCHLLKKVDENFRSLPPHPCHLLKKGEGRRVLDEVNVPRPSRADRGGSRDDENFRLARHQVPGFLLTLQKLPLARRQLPFLPSPPTTFTERSPILCLLKKSPCPPLSSKWTATR